MKKGTGLENRVLVPTVDPVEPLDEIQHVSEILAYLTEEECKTFDIARAAYEWSMDRDPRSLNILAHEVGCSREAIRKRAHLIWKTAGLTFMLKSAAARMAMSDAAYRRPKRKRRAAGGSIPAAVQTSQPSKQASLSTA